MSTGGKPQVQQTTNSGPPEWAQGNFEDALSKGMQVANQPWTGYKGQRVAGVGKHNPFSTYGSDTGIINQVRADVGGKYGLATAHDGMDQLSAGGAYGGNGAAMADKGTQYALGRELNQNAVGIRYQGNAARYADWDKMLGRQQQNLDNKFGDYQEKRDWRGNQLGYLSNALATVQGGSSTESVKNPNYTSAGQNAASAAAIIASIWSSRELKQSIAHIDPALALQAILSLPVDKWCYHGDTEQHAGTYSQDFYTALGMEPKPYINSIDMFGAIVAGMQALNAKLENNT